ncbi:MAG: hypothetical protein J5874_05565 [Oscillospiraceae bacterium]|nr:hypothetical protein [Oscillospiraceae bacterium]
MPKYSEQDLKYAAELREEIHRNALARVKAVYPIADHVVDEYPAEAYFQEVWDYPGQWYTVVGTPPGTGGKKDLTETIVRQTLAYYRNKENARSNDEFYRLIAKYPDIVCDYSLVGSDDKNANASGVFPYRGVDSHRLALECVARELFDSGKWSYDMKAARCRKLKSTALFAPTGADNWLNYRKAFLCPPHGNSYTDRDFEQVNDVLFPGGTECLEVYRWTTDWSEYFDEGHEWWGALCLTVYDKTLDRFVVIMASATD